MSTTSKSGKRSDPEPKTLSRVRDIIHNIQPTVEKDCLPLIIITINGKKFPALIDSGSPSSFISSEFLDPEHLKAIPKHSIQRRFRMLTGFIDCIQGTHLDVQYPGNQILQFFHLVPIPMHCIILRRDFLFNTNIDLHIGLRGWSAGGESSKIHPFYDPSPTSRQSIDSQDDKNPTPPDQSVPFAHLADALCMVDYQYDYMEPIEEEMENAGFTVPLHLSRPDCIQVPSTLSEFQISKLREVIYKYSEVFSKRPGLCNLYEHSIDPGTAKPIPGKLRPMTPGKRKVFDETFDELLELDVIEPGNGPWASNGFVVPKKDGNLRFVIDYQPLNKVTVSDVYPIPRMDESVLGSSRYFTTFDLSKGFHQIAMSQIKLRQVLSHAEVYGNSKGSLWVLKILQLHSNEW